MSSNHEEPAVDADWLRFLPTWLRRRLSGRHSVQAIVGNSGWLLVDRVGRLVVGLFISTWVARYLGPEQFGQLNFAMAFAMLFTPIAALGLDGIVVRELVRNPGNKEYILGAALSLKIIGGLAAATFVLLAIRMLRPSDGVSAVLVGIIAVGFVFQSVDVFDLWFQSRTQSKFTTYVRTPAFVACALVKVILIQLGASLTAFAWVILAEAILASIGLLVLYLKKERRSGTRLVLCPWSKMRDLLAISWPLFLSSVAGWLYVRVDQLMLAELKGNVEVGLYSAALRLSEVWYGIAAVVVASATPSLVRAQQESEHRYHARLQSLFTGLTRVAYAVILPVWFFSPFLVDLLYGHSYAAAAPVLAVHVWATLFSFLGAAFGAWAVNQGMTRLYLGQTFLGVVVNVALNLVLIPKYGALGSAIATLISQAMVTYVVLGFLRSTRPIFRIETKALVLRT